MNTWIASTPEERLVTSKLSGQARTSADGLALTGNALQQIRGFGGCFNELGYLAIERYLSEEDKETVYRELFSPDELNFTFNRAPVGANDFAEQWYSYDEHDGDYSLEHFSVGHDDDTLVPYIRHAQQYQPEMQLFSSPWSPPTWMKFPKAYNFGRIVMTPENLDAYARYFVRYIQSYAERGIEVTQLHVQNEVFADQKFPSCLWSSEDMRVFIRDYLGPAFDKAGIDTEIFLGTLNGPEDMAFVGGYAMKLENYNRYVDNILFDDKARSYIKGIGYQWAGQHCIARTHESWPELELLQTESECGNGDNSWEYAEYVFHLINHYLRNGATAYTYWNMALTEIVSTWGWQQNSLYSIDSQQGTFVRNPEWYVMRHFSTYVHPGAVVLETTGHFNSLGIAFRNPDGSIVLVVQNALDRSLPFDFADPEQASRGIDVVLAPRSFNTFIID
ncbi:MAG: glycoside hydrolase family 30 protein [Bifidobacterium psychraerophilum]|uniref:glycoside hydrolase family 30 protein n=1 Tax=Bifidobacterium psychraerophilum TaxID=218140 RepID=UPI0039EBB533